MLFIFLKSEDFLSDNDLCRRHTPEIHPWLGSLISQMWLNKLPSILVKDNRRSCYMLDAVAAGGGFPGVLPRSLRKSSSCSTIYMGMLSLSLHLDDRPICSPCLPFPDDSTISQPNLKNTIKCISLAIYYHIANRKNRAHERLMEIFEERLHPITVCIHDQVRLNVHMSFYEYCARQQILPTLPSYTIF